MKVLECSKPPRDLQVHQKAPGELWGRLKGKQWPPGYRSQTWHLGAGNAKPKRSEGTEKNSEASGLTAGSQRVKRAPKGPRSKLKGTQRLLGCAKRKMVTPGVA